MRISSIDNMSIKKHMKYLRKAAKKDYGLESHGFIYKVNSGFCAIAARPTCSTSNSKTTTANRLYEIVYIKEGALIEFRYERDFHFRTEDDEYYRVDPSIIALKCEVFAKIEEKVRYGNKLKLKEILETKSYTLLNK